MQGAFITFVHDPARGLFDYGWPIYDPNTLSLPLLGLAAENATGATWGKGSLLDFSCASMDALLDVQVQLNGILDKFLQKIRNASMNDRLLLESADYIERSSTTFENQLFGRETVLG